mmetsp:Transcript_79535/g.178282  ORF Transcript_79535/g.178282 Transcript_79535/m.178282 type:complete len:420 (+) Transcript_79535:97-1356(+)
MFTNLHSSHWLRASKNDGLARGPGETPRSKDDTEELVDVAEAVPVTLTGQIEIATDAGTMTGTAKGLSQDAYGAAQVAIARNSTVIAMKRKQGLPIVNNILRLLFSSSCMALNVGLQIAILSYISQFVVETAVHEVQQLYAKYREEVLDDAGDFVPGRWDSFAEKSEVCSITMTKREFYYSILTLWVLTNLHEIRELERFMRSVLKIKTCDDESKMLLFVDHHGPAGGLFSGECYIVALTRRVRACLIIFVWAPRLFIEIRLLFLGWRWLSASANFEDMVLNSLALTFVINIDELIYNSILPITTQKQISETRFFQEEAVYSLDQVEVNERWGFYRTIFFVALLLVVMFSYGELFQSVLPPDLQMLREACSSVLRQGRSPYCSQMAFQLRHNRSSCYPSMDRNSTMLRLLTHKLSGQFV